MALANVQVVFDATITMSTSVSGVTVTRAWTSNTTAGNLLVATLAFARASSYTVTCSTSGWTRATGLYTSGVSQTEMWYKIAEGTDTPPIFRIDDTTSIKYMDSLSEWSGLTAGTSDTIGSAIANTTSPLTLAVSGTTATAGELVISISATSILTSGSHTMPATSAGGSATFGAGLFSAGGSGAESAFDHAMGWATAGASGTSPSIIHTISGTATSQTSNGVVVAFKTSDLAVSTQAISSVTQTTATGNGNILSVVTGNADERGFVYDTDSRTAPSNVSPASSGYASFVNSTGSFTTGAYTNTLTLQAGKKYYVRSYCHNSTTGYVYGAEQTFYTPHNNFSNAGKYLAVGAGMSTSGVAN